jgi:hypothetical protein
MVLGVLLMVYAVFTLLSVAMTIFQTDEVTAYNIGFFVGQTFMVVLFILLGRKAYTFGKSRTVRDEIAEDYQP